jgi:DNA helicase II / ATP-dependent DNA helicase PcrA
MSAEDLAAAFHASKLQINYERELNEQQLAAVTALPQPALVIAGAGSGKTRTLIYRVGYLLEQGIPPDRILLLTFTNKAAREMMRRVTDLLGSDLSRLWGGTFHSIGNRILRKHASRLGYGPDFTILDRDDSEALIKSCVTDAAIEAKGFPKPPVLSEIFSLAANIRSPIAKLLAERYIDFSDLTESISALNESFKARKKAGNLMDFDDLLVLWLKLMQEHPDICEQYQRRFQFILVDEYQDTNQLQSDVIDLLAERHKNVMVVGDDAQSIYSWRGARFLNIFEFPNRYQKAQVYKIEINYRSTPEILALANAAIALNTRQFTKELTSARRSGIKPVVAACMDAGQQANFIAFRVLQLRDGGMNLSDIAVLYRSHFHAVELQLELTRRNIPFTITSGIRFFEQAHIKDAVAYLKFLANPHDEISFRRLVRMLPGVGEKAAENLWRKFQPQLKGLDRGGATPAAADATPTATKPVLAARLQACASAVSKKAATAWADFVITIAQLETMKNRRSPSAMIEQVLESGYDEYLEANYTNYRIRKEDLEQLSSYALQFQSADDFLAQLALLTNLEAEQDREAEKNEDQLRLSTIHQAKGLEFGAVFIIMLCERLFPSGRSLEDPDALEEERRLFYVAMTRAKDELYLSYPLLRRIGPDVSPQVPSQFVSALPEELYDLCDLTSSTLPGVNPSSYY